MTPDPEKHSCNLNTKERIEFIFYLLFHTRSNLAQNSKKNGHLTIQQNHGHRYLSEIMVTV